MHEFTLAIVGIDYANADRAKTNRRTELMLLDVGTPLELRLEPQNKHDEHAIGIWSPNGVQVGYVSSARAPWVGGHIKRGEEIATAYQGLVGKAGYVRVRVGGGAPTLPPVVISMRQDVPDGEFDTGGDGFWPDEQGPEWGA